MNINPWIALCAPFVIVGLGLLALKGFERFEKWRAERQRRIRNEQMRKYGLVHWKNSKDGFLR